MTARWAFALAVVIALLGAAPATAKMPPYSCELSTTRPVVGERVRVEVRFWNDAEHTDPARWWFVRRLHDFVSGRAIDRDQPLAYSVRGVRATVVRVGPGVYRGELVFPSTRRFRIERCGGGYDRRGYPIAEGIVITPRAFVGADPGRVGAGSERRTIELGAVVLGGVGTAIAVGSALRSRRRRRPAAAVHA